MKKLETISIPIITLILLGVWIFLQSRNHSKLRLSETNETLFDSCDCSRIVKKPKEKDCYFRKTMILTGSPSFCEVINDTNIKEECCVWVREVIKDQFLCERINSKRNKDKYYRHCSCYPRVKYL